MLATIMLIVVWVAAIGVRKTKPRFHTGLWVKITTGCRYHTTNPPFL